VDITLPANAFSEMTLLLALAAVAGTLAIKLRQPVLIAYIVVGILVGPAFFGLVQSHEQIELLAQIGVAVLLFVVGLKLDITHVRHIGPVALATGLGQLTFTIIIGFLIVLALGKGFMEALYVAVALTFSSTIIIVKLLSDKRELDSLHGRIAVGFLIVQDIAVVIAMMAMSALRDTGAEAGSMVLLGLAGRILLAGVLLFIMMRWVLPALVAFIARSQELLLLFAIAWGTGLAALGEWAGFSQEAGAFLAGFSLASTPYREAIGARLTGIRDFLLLFFFVDLGARLDFSTLGAELLPALVLSLFVLIGNPLIVMAIMGYMGYRKRTGLLAGLTVAQISEFSIVFVAMGISLGHVGVQVLGLTTLVGIITITVSTYMILYSQTLYERLAPLLGIFERRNPFREQALESGTNEVTRADVILFGLGRYGARLAHLLQARGLSVLAVDFDPEVVASQRRQGLSVHFGDSQDADFLATLPWTENTWALSTLPDLQSNRALLHALSVHHAGGRAAIAVRDEMQSAAFAGLGHVTLLHPFRDALESLASELCQHIKNTEKTP
jgi:Kef-type K+ transport system membrane component KefB